MADPGEAKRRLRRVDDRKVGRSSREDGMIDQRKRGRSGVVGDDDCSNDSVFWKESVGENPVGGIDVPDVEWGREAARCM